MCETKAIGMGRQQAVPSQKVKEKEMAIDGEWDGKKNGCDMSDMAIVFI